MFTRLDSLSPADPDRYVTGIHIDADNPNRAWISYSGFNASTPSTPGHIFRVDYDPSAGTATWESLDGSSLGDLPLTDVARNDATGDLFVSSDFGVLRSDTSGWIAAGSGMPHVEVAGLTMVQADDGDGHGRHSRARLYAATHGLGAWLLELRNRDDS